MTDKGFIFDYSKCVGCHACIVACYNENHTQPPLSWRQVQSYNKLKVPLSGFINLSLACNHCDAAPCLNACPAKAYQKDEVTGAIIHNAEKCIGCSYCTWACPFDAPRFNPSKGVVEKCNFCNDRLKVGLIPACTNSCPTGALTFNGIEISDRSTAPGMANNPTKPRVNFINPEIVKSKPIMDLIVTGFIHHESLRYPSKEKIDALKEWPLAVFTLISSFLVGWIIFLLFDTCEVKYGYLFAGLSLTAMALSLLHLGKPLRAYRSILNVKTSWLSREIILFSIFVGISLIVFFISSTLVLISVAVIAGLLLLVAIEYVYSVAHKKFKTIVHSANTLLTAVTFAFILTDLHSIAIGLIALKGILYINRYAYQTISIGRLLLGFVRFFIGILIPLVSLMLLSNVMLAIIISFVIGEIIDRFEFYSDLHIDTPQYILNEQLNSEE